VDKDLRLAVDPTMEFTSRSEVENKIVNGGAEEESDESSDVQSCDSDSASPNRAEYTYTGSRDSDGFFHGGGRITFSNGDEIVADFEHGIRNGDGMVISTRSNIARLWSSH